MDLHEVKTGALQLRFFYSSFLLIFKLNAMAIAKCDDSSSAWYENMKSVETMLVNINGCNLELCSTSFLRVSIII